MKILLRAALVLLACSLVAARGADKAEIEKLVAQLKAAPGSNDSGMGVREQELAGEFVKIGSAANPYLIPLLKEENEVVSNRAAFILRDMPGLQETDLDALMKYERGHEGWIAPAIASIGTPRAVSFLVGEIVQVRDVENQLGFAIQKLGPKAIPDLVAIYRDKDIQWDFHLIRAMTLVFREMGKKADGAVAPLLEIACDKTVAKEGRLHALEALGAIGPSAAPVVPELKKLGEDEDKEIRAASNSAIMAIGTVDAVPRLLHLLEKEDDHYDQVMTIRDIAELGPNGVSAGPALMKYLTGDGWETRMAAARAVGYIGYEGAVDQLIAALSNQEDWRLVYNAAESLGRLHARKAEPMLKKVGQTYWYPHVREKAAEALSVVREGGTMKSCPSAGDSFALEFDSFQAPREEKETLEYADASALGLPWGGPNDKALPAEALQPGAERQLGSRRVVRVDHGYLVGRNGGEWGGGLTFYGEHGARLILPANTQEIFLMKGGALAVATRGYSEYGTLYKLTPDGRVGWRAKEWRELPGPAWYSLILKDGRLLAGCSGGLVVVSPDGKMKMITKAEAVHLLGK